MASETVNPPIEYNPNDAQRWNERINISKKQAFQFLMLNRNGGKMELNILIIIFSIIFEGA
jgi:hypothetical protein